MNVACCFIDTSCIQTATVKAKMMPKVDFIEIQRLILLVNNKKFKL
jgi:hypothetical protein